MKILWLTNYPSPYRVEFFSKLGEEVELTVLFEQTIAQQTHRNQDWFCTEYRNFQAVFLKKRKGKGLEGVFKALRQALKKEYDYVVLADYTAAVSIVVGACMRLIRKPYAISIDGAYERPGSRLKNAIKRFLVKPARFFLSSSRTSDEYLMRLGAKEERIHRYHFTSLSERDLLGHLPTEEEKASLKEELGITEPFSVLLVGRFVPIKGMDFVLKAASRLRSDIGYYIAGDQPTQEYLEIVKQNGLEHVHFIGFQKKEELKRYYCACDLFAFPTRYDPWGLVVNEAMACGMPILSTDRSSAALHFIRNGENGFVYPCDDVEAYLENMNLLYADPALCRAMGQANWELIRTYTIETMAKQHVAVFQEEQKKAE